MPEKRTGGTEPWRQPWPRRSGREPTRRMSHRRWPTWPEQGAAERAAGTARRITLEAVYGTIIGGVHRTSRGVLPFASNYDAALLGACGLEHPSKLEAAILEDVGAEPPTGYSWGGALGDAYPEVRPINYLEAGRSLDYLGLRIFYETIHYVAYPAARSART